MKSRNVTAAMATVLLAGALVIPPMATADSTSITVTFRVNPSVSAETVSDGLLVRSNAPWTLVAETPDGAVTISGPATGSPGTLVEIPPTATYSLVLDSTK